MQRPTSRNSRQYHGLGGTPTYVSWYSMLDRCINPENVAFYRYGGRGIKVCEKWLSIEGFVEDMGLRPEGHTIDRIDLDGDYCRENCRWADELTQQRGRSNVKMTLEKAAAARDAFARGQSQREIADALGVHQSNISRVLAGKIWV